MIVYPEEILRERIKALEEALQEIADVPQDRFWSGQTMVEIARKALGDKTNDQNTTTEEGKVT